MERKHAESDRPEEPLGRLLLFWNILHPLFVFLLYWPCGASLLGNEIFIISFYNIPCFWIVERSQNIKFLLVSLLQPSSSFANSHLSRLRRHKEIDGGNMKNKMFVDRSLSGYRWNVFVWRYAELPCDWRNRLYLSVCGLFSLRSRLRGELGIVERGTRWEWDTFSSTASFLWSLFSVSYGCFMFNPSHMQPWLSWNERKKQIAAKIRKLFFPFFF